MSSKLSSEALVRDLLSFLPLVHKILEHINKPLYRHLNDAGGCVSVLLMFHRDPPKAGGQRLLVRPVHQRVLDVARAALHPEHLRRWKAQQRPGPHS